MIQVKVKSAKGLIIEGKRYKDGEVVEVEPYAFARMQNVLVVIGPPEYLEDLRKAEEAKKAEEDKAEEERKPKKGTGKGK